MSRKNITLFAMLMATIILFPGCKKEKTAELAATQAASGMLCFNSPEDFAETQQKVLAMSETERREWERQQGFKSYATKCYELFEELEARGIESDEDICNFVKENPDYFYIHVEDGEEYLASYLEGSPYYNFANEMQLLQVSNSYWKIFDEGIVTANAEQLNLLLTLNHYQDAISYSELSCLPIKRSVIFSSVTQEENTRDKNKFWLDVDQPQFIRYIAQRSNWRMGNRNVIRAEFIEDMTYDPDPNNPNIPPLVQDEVWVMDRPYHRVSGIWYWCQRTITYNVDIAYKINGEEQSYHRQHPGDGVHGFSSQIYWNFFIPGDNSFVFTKLKGWAKTPDTPQIDMKIER